MQGLLLGAGASYELGMPLVWELTKVLELANRPEILRTIQQCQHAGSAMHWSDESVELLTYLLSDEELHYEAVIGAIEVEAQRRLGPQNSYDRIRMHLVDIVSRALIERHRREKSFTISGLKYTLELNSFIEKNRPLRIFTLNHDVMVEEICANLGRPVKAGFYRDLEYWPSVYPDSSFSFPFEVLTEANIKTDRFNFFNPGEEGVNLYKLHGSLDTFLFNSCKDFIRFHPKEIKVGSHIDMLAELADENDRLEMQSSIRSIDMLTIKDSKGVEQFFDRSLITGAHKFQNSDVGRHALRVFFEKFKEDIAYIEELFCIGYSFGDLHVNKVISDWLCRSSANRLIIVDPFCKSVPSFLLHLKKQVSIEGKTFLDFLRSPPINNQEKMERYFFGQFREFRRLQTHECV